MKIAITGATGLVGTGLERFPKNRRSCYFTCGAAKPDERGYFLESGCRRDRYPLNSKGSMPSFISLERTLLPAGGRRPGKSESGKVE